MATAGGPPPMPWALGRSGAKPQGFLITLGYYRWSAVFCVGFL
jgi:hypothetical protein